MWLLISFFPKTALVLARMEEFWDLQSRGTPSCGQCIPCPGIEGGILTCPWPSVLIAAEGAAFKWPLDSPTPQSIQRSLRRWERMQMKEDSRDCPGVSLPRTELGVPSHTGWRGQSHHSPPWACSSLHFPRVCKIWPGDYLRKRRHGWVGHEFWGKPLRVNESLAAFKSEFM